MKPSKPGTKRPSPDTEVNTGIKKIPCYSKLDNQTPLDYAVTFLFGGVRVEAAVPCGNNVTGRKTYGKKTDDWLVVGNKTDRVYFGRDVETGEIVYVGKSNDIIRRGSEHVKNGKTFRIRDLKDVYGKDYPNLTPHQARAIEQYYIDKFGMQKLDGLLENKNNSVAIDRDIYPGTQQFADDFINNYNLK